MSFEAAYRDRSKTVDAIPSFPYGLDILNLDGSISSTASYLTTPTSTQHECQDWTNKGPPYRSGRELSISKVTENYSDIVDAGNLYVHPFIFKGGSIARYQPPVGFAPPGASSFDANDLTVLGTQGWNRYRPLQSNLDLNQFIGELRDFQRLAIGVKKQVNQLLSGRLLNDIPVAAGSYLWYQFGFKPVLRDILAMTQAHEFTRKRVQFILKNNGKEHKRGGTLLETEETIHSVRNINAYWAPAYQWGAYSHYYAFNHGNMIHSSLTTKRKVWFEGKFGFWLPVSDYSGPEFHNRMFLNQGLGLQLNAYALLRTFYALTPWSWLFDWVTTLGDVLENMASINGDGVYARYAHIMASDEYRYFQLNLLNTRGGQQVQAMTRTATFKQREIASPYGFGIDTSDFSDWQLSILLALGLSRL